MVKHNNVLVNNHFRKRWADRVKTWFNQPARKAIRRRNRKVKAARVFPRPVSGNLRPVVHCPTQKYNMRVRSGRGFTIGELKTAGIAPCNAIGLGISIDKRRQDRSRETLNANVQRLKLYRSKQIIYPIRTHNRHPKKKSKTPADKVASDKPATAMDVDKKKKRPKLNPSVVQQSKPLPFHVQVEKEEFATITPAMREASAWKSLRSARGKANKVGAVAKKAKLAAEKAALGPAGGDAKAPAGKAGAKGGAKPAAGGAKPAAGGAKPAAGGAKPAAGGAKPAAAKPAAKPAAAAKPAGDK